jgi:hypothetical protein
MDTHSAPLPPEGDSFAAMYTMRERGRKRERERERERESKS